MPSLAERLQQYLASLKINPQDGTNQDYDPNFEAGVSGGIRDLTNYANQLDLNNRQSRVGYEQQLADLGRQREQTTENLQNRLSGQGILHSGINIGEQAKIGEGYQRGVNSAATGLANTEQTNEMGFSNAQNSFSDMLKQLQNQNTQYVTQRRAARAKEEAETAAAQERVRQEAAALVQNQLPPLSPTGQFIPQEQQFEGYSPTVTTPFGYEASTDWMQDIQAIPNLQDAYGYNQQEQPIDWEAIRRAFGLQATGEIPRR